MQDLKDKPSTWLHTAYQVWHVCCQGKARLLQHTNSQLKTFWSESRNRWWWIVWYIMDRLNRKRYIRNPMLIESTIYINLIKTVLSAPQLVLDTDFKILSVLRHSFLGILIWGRKVSFITAMMVCGIVSSGCVASNQSIFHCKKLWYSYLLKY